LLDSNVAKCGRTFENCIRTAIDSDGWNLHLLGMATILLEPPHAEGAASGATLDALQRKRARAVVWLTLVFWGSNYIMLTLATALSPKPHLLQISLVRLATMLLGLFFCFLIHLLLRRPFLSTTRQRLIALAIAAPILAETFAWASFFSLAFVDPTLTLKNFTWSGAVSTVSFWTWFFLAWAGLYLAIAYSFDVQEEQQHTAESRERAHAAQLRALHSQINPHFLFNSLNSLSALILDGKKARAEEMVGKLSHFLRLGLAADPNQKIRLSAEIELQRTYLELEQLRYEDLELEFSVPATLSEALVPALILQPLIENAVKYGVAGSPPPARIRIGAWSDGGLLHVQVSDSGKGNPGGPPGAGIGLSNVIQRLRLIYGESGVQLLTSRLPEGGFCAELVLPLELA
jgi:two-component system LytT family sensor kinase